MNKYIRIRVYKFLIIGALSGALMGLISSYFMNFMLISYTTQIFLTYEDWALACVPTFAVIGSLVHGLFAILTVEEEETGLRRLFKKK